MKQKNIARQVVFPAPLYKLMETRLDQLGISAPEYVRQLVIEDVKPLYKEIPFVDEEAEKSIGRAIEDIKNGKIHKFNSLKELREFLHNL